MRFIVVPSVHLFWGRRNSEGRNLSAAALTVASKRCGLGQDAHDGLHVRRGTLLVAVVHVLENAVVLAQHVRDLLLVSEGQEPLLGLAVQAVQRADEVAHADGVGGDGDGGRGLRADGVGALGHDVLLETVGLGLFPCRWFKYGTSARAVQPVDKKCLDEF